MKKLIVVLLAVIASCAQGQVYRDRVGFDLESISEMNLGWMKMYRFTTPPKAKHAGDRTYSATQIGYSQQFIEWMQSSYLPKGCLGDAGYYQNYIPKFSSTNSRLGNAINTHASALPHLYGAFTKMYMYLKKGPGGKFVPQVNLAEYWYVEANGLQHISKPVSFISSSKEYFFVLPDFERHPNGYDDQDKSASDFKGFRNHRNIAGYTHFYIPPRVVGDLPFYVVILSKENALPFEALTIGEFLIAAEKQLPVWQGITPVSAEQYKAAQRNLGRLKEKYKGKWNEVAKLTLTGTQISLIDFVNATEGYIDFFDDNGIATFPILRVKMEALELCRKDRPQWLVIRWTMGLPNEAFNVHLHESILNNFNFDYAYNFFFNPEKVRGQSYRPLRSPSHKEEEVQVTESEAGRKAKADESIVFYDDFSTTGIGRKPAGWQAKLANGGTSALVASPGGLEGSWVELRGHQIKAALKKSLPQDFTLTYDLVASQNFTWGAKGLSMQLSFATTSGNAESYVMVRLRPGFDGRDGEVTLETAFPNPPGYANGTKWYVAKGFSNDKKVNRVRVSLKKKGESLLVFIDETKIAEYEKAIPLAQPFNTLSFDCSGNSAENDTYLISNIRIRKD